MSDCMYNYGTLDDLPTVHSQEDWYNLLLRRYEHWVGPIFAGRAEDEGDEQQQQLGYWGRPISAPSREQVQIRFAPRDMMTQPSTTGVVLFAERVTGTMPTIVRTCILMDMETQALDVDPMRFAHRDLACKGLFMWHLGVFRRHNPDVSERRGKTESWKIDGEGFPQIIPTHSTVVHPDALPTRKHKATKEARKEAKAILSPQGTFTASPGLAHVQMAGEIIGVTVSEGTGNLHDTYPVDVWTAMQAAARVELTTLVHRHKLGDQQTAADALGAASILTEVLSAEGLLGLASSEFFAGALPRAAINPDGMPFILVFAMRLAMLPGRFELRPGNALDTCAAAQARMIFESTNEPLELMGTPVFAIDLVMRRAYNQAREHRIRGKSKEEAQQANRDLLEKMLYWQRLGARALTGCFGVQPDVGKEPVDTEGGPLGSARRMRDPLAEARDRYMATLPKKFERITAPGLHLATVADRKTQCINWMTDVEVYLRTGKKGDKQLAKANTEDLVQQEMDSEEHQKQLKEALDTTILRTLREREARGDTIETGASLRGLTDDDRVWLYYANHCVEARQHGVALVAMCMLHGSLVHHQLPMRAYISSAAQVVPCVTCSKPVHVLAGILAETAFGVCTRCHGRKCFACTHAMQQQMLVMGSSAGLPACNRCGAVPPTVIRKDKLQEHGIVVPD